jgi:hypothetical protein
LDTRRAISRILDTSNDPDTDLSRGPLTLLASGGRPAVADDRPRAMVRRPAKQCPLTVINASSAFDLVIERCVETRQADDRKGSVDSAGISGSIGCVDERAKSVLQ